MLCLVDISGMPAIYGENWGLVGGVGLWENRGMGRVEGGEVMTSMYHVRE